MCVCVVCVCVYQDMFIIKQLYITPFRLGAVMCLGAMAGAYIVTLFAVCSNLYYSQLSCFLKRILGLLITFGLYYR